MTHKRAIKKLMGFDIERNEADKLLRECAAHGYSNNWVIAWKTAATTLIRYAAKNEGNWCYFRQQTEQEGMGR